MYPQLVSASGIRCAPLDYRFTIAADAGNRFSGERTFLSNRVIRLITCEQGGCEQ
jgi:hypothetical protein